jgi:predicted ATPase
MPAAKTPAKKRAPKRPSLLRHLRWIANESMLMHDGPFRMSVKAGNPRLAVIVGENASGKSLAFRMLSQVLSDTGATVVSTSIRARTQEGFARMAMYGAEAEQSTGATTAQWILKSFSQLERKGGSLLALDEPELGLSEGYARALGQFVGEQSKLIPDCCGGVVVVTHSRPFVEALIQASGRQPTFANMTDQVMSADEWLAAEETRSVEDLLALREMAHERWLAVHRIMEGR